MEIVHIFHSGYLYTRGTFQVIIDLPSCSKLNIADKETCVVFEYLNTPACVNYTTQSLWSKLTIVSVCALKSTVQYEH